MDERLQPKLFQKQTGRCIDSKMVSAVLMAASWLKECCFGGYSFCNSLYDHIGYTVLDSCGETDPLQDAVFICGSQLFSAARLPSGTAQSVLLPCPGHLADIKQQSSKSAVEAAKHLAAVRRP